MAEARSRGTDLVVSYDLFLNDTARRFADVVLPGTAWLEELGCKSTNTHLYLMPKVLEPAGRDAPGAWVLRELARRLGVADFYPWADDAGPIDAILDHPATGHATVAALRAEGGMRALRVSHVGHPGSRVSRRRPARSSSTRRARASSGLPPLPVHEALPASSLPAACSARGAPSTHFHGFYDHGRALPTLAAARPRAACSGSRPPTRPRAASADGAAIRIFNERGEMQRAGARDRPRARAAPCGCATAGTGSTG